MRRGTIDDRFAVLAAPADIMVSGGNPFAPDVFDYRSKTTFNYFHQLIPERRRVLDQLLETIRREETEALEDIFGKGRYADVLELTKAIYTAPLMAARKRFEPDPFYSAVDFEGLPTGAQRRLLENSAIVSGLFGLLRPDDLVPEHNLNLAAVVPGIGSLTSFWRPRISPLLNKVVQDRFVWDLLPESFRDVWDDDESHNGRGRVKFMNANGREVKMDTVYRGQMMNFIVRGPIVEPEVLSDWRHPGGFKFSRKKSDLEGRHKTIAMVRRY